MTNELVSGVGLGLLLGVRHALEPDHLAAVSTLVVGLADGQADSQPSPRRGALLGAAWGLGHTAALLGAALALGVLRAQVAQMPEALAAGFEALVALMLIGLGLRTLGDALRGGSEGPTALHQHRRLRHVHRGPDGHVHVGRWTLARRPLLIGMVHGLAGSGALTTLVLLRMPSVPQRLGYVALFGLGSIIGMALLSGLVGLPLMRLSRSPRLARGLTGAAGLGSLGVGLYWGAAQAARLFG